jgi:hypothetical protein
MIKWVRTTKMAKDPWHKGRIGKIKNSPAANKLRGLKDNVMDAVFPLDNTHMKTRVDHFNEGSTEHETHMIVRSQDLPHAGSIVDQHHDKGLSPQPFKEGNVSSIMNGFQIRNRKTPPEGY